MKSMDQYVKWISCIYIYKPLEIISSKITLKPIVKTYKHTTALYEDTNKNVLGRKTMAAKKCEENYLNDFLYVYFIPMYCSAFYNSFFLNSSQMANIVFIRILKRFIFSTLCCWVLEIALPHLIFIVVFSQLPYHIWFPVSSLHVAALLQSVACMAWRCLVVTWQKSVIRFKYGKIRSLKLKETHFLTLRSSLFRL